MTDSKYTPKFLARFWSRIDCTAGLFECWLWTAATNRDGYGSIGLGQEWCAAHRIAYDLAYGDLRDGLDVCHTCDNPGCCNPSHLFQGTRLENLQDMSRKGRNGRGEQDTNSKLTNAQVAEIHRLYETKAVTQRSLAAMFHVSQSLISNILNGKKRRYG